MKLKPLPSGGCYGLREVRDKCRGTRGFQFVFAFPCITSSSPSQLLGWPTSSNSRPAADTLLWTPRQQPWWADNFPQTFVPAPLQSYSNSWKSLTSSCSWELWAFTCARAARDLSLTLDFSLQTFTIPVPYTIVSLLEYSLQTIMLTRNLPPWLNPDWCAPGPWARSKTKSRHSVKQRELSSNFLKRCSCATRDLESHEGWTTMAPSRSFDICSLQLRGLPPSLCLRKLPQRIKVAPTPRVGVEG